MAGHALSACPAIPLDFLAWLCRAILAQEQGRASRIKHYLGVCLVPNVFAISWLPGVLAPQALAPVFWGVE